jgi:DNA-binding response OmpR family regulator
MKVTDSRSQGYSRAKSYIKKERNWFVIAGSKPTKQRVLLVEDSLDTGHTLAYLLRDAGHEVEFAINGYSALTIAERLRPTIVFLDIGLPDFDGCALARRIRRLPYLEHTRIIAITGRVSDDDHSRALAAGCEQFLRKPVSPEILEAIVNGHVGPSTDSALASVRPFRRS